MADPAIPQITYVGSMLRDDSNAPTPVGNKKYITTTATTLVKSGAGFLYSVTLNKPVATGTIEIDDAVTQTNPFAIITSPTGVQPSTIFYNVAFTTGLSITTATAAQDITVSYR